MKQSVFRLRLENGEFKIVPFRHVPEENILTPEGFRRKPARRKTKKKK